MCLRLRYLLFIEPNIVQEALEGKVAPSAKELLKIWFR